MQKRVDNNLIETIKVNRKVGKLLRKGSNCTLIFILIIEGIILVLLIFYGDKNINQNGV